MDVVLMGDGEDEEGCLRGNARGGKADTRVCERNTKVCGGQLIIHT
jgi:hypothetical protein